MVVLAVLLDFLGLEGIHLLEHEAVSVDGLLEFGFVLRFDELLVSLVELICKEVI